MSGHVSPPGIRRAKAERRLPQRQQRAGRGAEGGGGPGGLLALSGSGRVLSVVDRRRRPVKAPSFDAPALQTRQRAVRYWRVCVLARNGLRRHAFGWLAALVAAVPWPVGT